MSKNAEQHTPERALRLIWDGYEDGVYFETCSSPISRSHHRDLEGAITAAHEAQFFGLLPRKREGSKKPDVIDQGNVLWVDLDFPEAGALVAEMLEPLGLLPTMVICSGRGYWFFWKLNDAAPKGDIEQMNKRLVRLLGGDSGSTDCTRIARVPGSTNTKHAHKPCVEVRFLDESLRYAIGDFDRALPKVPAVGSPSSSYSTNHVFDPNDRVEGIEWTDPDWLGRPDLAAYVFGGRRDGDRSHTEAQVAAKLLSCGWCRGEIHTFFRKYGLPRYLLDQRTGRAHNLDLWIDEVIHGKSKAWDLKKLNPPLDPPSVHRGSGHSPKETGNSLSTYDRRRVLVDMARGQTLSEYYEEASKTLGRCRRSTRNDLSILTYKGGPLVYACDLLDPNHRRKRIYRNEAVAGKVHERTLIAHSYLGSSRRNDPPRRRLEKKRGGR
jgi:hypothetical protein